MSFDSVVPKPVYTMVDLDKKRRDRVKAKYLSQIPSSSAESSDGPAGTKMETNMDPRAGIGESQLHSLSTTHNYEEIADQTLSPQPTTTEESAESSTTRPEKSSYTMISKKTLLSSQDNKYEDTNIRLSKKGSTCTQKLQCAVIAFVLLFLFLATCSGFALTFLKVMELKSQIDSAPQMSDITSLMQTILDLRENETSTPQTFDTSGLMQIIYELEANASLLSDQYAATKERLGSTTNILHDLLQHHQYLLDTLEHLGLPSSPANSCANLLAFSPSTPSGYYWVRASNGSAVRVYCDMTRSCGGVTGGWMRVAELDTTNNNTQCPGDFTMQNYSNISTCGIRVISSINGGSGCSSATFSLSGVQYSRVCGRVKAYQIGSPEAFHPERTLSDVYVDGISLTHGIPPQASQHIWSWAAASSNSTSNCPCFSSNQTHSPIPPPLPFVGQHYFCDTASQEGSSEFTDFSNPLWNGEDCLPYNSCCSFNNPPWFYRQLSQLTTDNMEMRVCADEVRANEDIAIASFEIYVQ